jgi:hypothetical protein
MADETKTAPATASETNAAGALRDVPSNIADYQKFVADGGNEHNEKILNRESALAAAKSAGVLPDADAEKQAQEQDQRHRSSSSRRLANLHRKIGERDEKIRVLEAQIGAGTGNGTGARSPESARTSAPPDSPAAAHAAPAGQRVNGKAEPPPRPVETDPQYKTYGEFIEALTDWKVARQLEKQAEESAARAAHRADADKGKAIVDAHNARVDQAKTRYSDWDSAFRGLNDESFTEPMVVFIFESERGPDITYYLAKNREELERIAKLPPLRQAAELGRIESRLDAEAAATDNGGDEGGEEDEDEQPEPEAPPVRKAPEKRKPNATKAPPPAKPIGGNAGKGSDDMPDPSNFQAYEAWSRRQAARGVKR